MTDAPPPAILLFGAGRMGSAMLRGWLGAGVPGPSITVVDPSPSAAVQRLADECGVTLDQPAEPRPSQAIVLAVKPQLAGTLRPTLAGLAAPDTMLISLMAGKTLANLAALAPAIGAAVRAMPNLPAAVGRGATVAVASAGCGPAQRARATRLLGTTGTIDWLDDEVLIDAATGISGCGPAYLFYLAECLTDAGVGAGLPPDIAERLARATIAGAGEMLHATDRAAAELRRDVTSPAGATEAGLSVLMADGTLRGLIDRTVAAAIARSRELAG